MPQYRVASHTHTVHTQYSAQCGKIPQKCALNSIHGEFALIAIVSSVCSLESFAGDTNRGRGRVPDCQGGGTGDALLLGT